LVDYHIHTQHSIDASGTISEYCEQAINIGLDEICFTNHCELDPRRNDSFIVFKGNRESFSRDGLMKLQAEIFEARSKYWKRGLTVKFGIEVGYYIGMEPTLLEILHGVDLDFLIGAIHCLNHICIDSSKECGLYFDHHEAHQLIEEYFTSVAYLVESGLFDSLAHIDVYKKYGRSYYGTDIYNLPQDFVKRVFHLIKNNHIALEINTAGMRFMNEFYPAPVLMKMAREAGVELITIGSDSHRPEDLGKDLARGLEYMKQYGFNTICTFDKRKRSIRRI
jgi:histidinol-phosphatase (PHP family)